MISIDEVKKSILKCTKVGLRVLHRHSVSMCLLSVLLTTSCGPSDTSTVDLPHEERLLGLLDSSSEWLIEEGISFYESEGADGLFDRLLDDSGVQLWANPQVYTERDLARFAIQIGVRSYEVLLLYEMETNNVLYGYWIVMAMPSAESNESFRTTFYITKASDRFSSREILYKSNQFIDSIEIEPDVLMEFPIDDLRLIYYMRPWDFLSSYKNTDLGSRIISYNEDRGYFVVD